MFSQLRLCEDHLKVWMKYGSYAVFVITSLIYLIGYLKLFWFLYILKVNTTPTDIYPITSIFLSGLTSLSISLIVPFIALLISFILYRYGPPKIMIFLLSFFCSETIYLLANLFKNTGFNFLPTSALIKLVNVTKIPTSHGLYSESIHHWVMICLIMVITLVGYRLWNKSHMQKIMLLFVILVSWIVLNLFSHGYALTGVNVGSPVTYETLDSGVLGIIATDYPISNESIVRKDLDKSYFVTRGILLYKTESTYYFVPGIYASYPSITDMPSTKLCIVPSTKTIGFYEIKSRK